MTEEEWNFFLEKRYVEDALGNDNYEDAVNFIIDEYHMHKAVLLFCFVIGRIQSLSEAAAEAIASRAQGRARMPEGKEFVGEWNETYPQWAYRTSVGDLNTRLFWRDFNRIEKTIAVGPPYQRYGVAATQQPRQTDGS